MIGKRDLENISLKINMKKRNFPVEVSLVVGDFREYENKPGVWACYGIKKKAPDNEWVCLNVGESDNIGKEMRLDRKYSGGKFNHRAGIYKNYKGDKVFTFVRPKKRPISSRERVWYDIGKKFKCLYFVIVSESSDENERLRIEGQYARDHDALYWNPSPKQKGVVSNANTS